LRIPQQRPQWGSDSFATQRKYQAILLSLKMLSIHQKMRLVFEYKGLDVAQKQDRIRRGALKNSGLFLR
jgi:hypothetical protein